MDDGVTRIRKIWEMPYLKYVMIMKFPTEVGPNNWI